MTANSKFTHKYPIHVIPELHPILLPYPARPMIAIIPFTPGATSAPGESAPSLDFAPFPCPGPDAQHWGLLSPLLAATASMWSHSAHRGAPAPAPAGGAHAQAIPPTAAPPRASGPSPPCSGVGTGMQAGQSSARRGRHWHVPESQLGTVGCV